MSKLDELIQTLCPDGVEYKPIGLFAKHEKKKNTDLHCSLAYSITKGGLVKTSEYFKEAKVTSDDISGYRIVKKNWFVYSPSRIDVGSINYLRDVDEVIVSPLNVVFSIDETVIRPDFLLSCLSSRSGTWQILMNREGIEGTGRKLLPFDKFAKIRIPVPPMEIQEEVMRILNIFTEFSETLAAELTARKKQYEYYRDELLSFGNDVPCLSIGDVCNLSAGGDVPKDRFSEEKTDTFTVPIYSNGIGENALYGFTDIPKVKERCVTIAARGTIGYPALRTEPFYPIIRLICAVPKDGLLPDYLYYAIQTIKFQVPKTGIPQLTVPMVSKYKIPVPSVDTQAKVVNTLDRFYALCNDISTGLPAEIEARRKQYEYYRDKLLTFKEVGV